tara:strand:+ start:136 stop:342 length:207 start_codon:yes stop_codon:yes gene_type:complete
MSMNKENKFYEEVHNYTKYKLVEMLINKHKDNKLDNLNAIEQLADDALETLALCGLKYYSKIKSKENK